MTVSESDGADESQDHESRVIAERSSPRTPVIYQVVRRLGEEEMDRPSFSLWWSGFAAGLSLSLSPFAQALLQTHLPDELWRPLGVALGYSVGFVIVVLARQQLFTENTITVVLPLLADFTPRNLYRLLRLWCIVFVANMAGGLTAAAFYSLTPALQPEVYDEMVRQSGQIIGHGWAAMIFKGIAAGYLMAAMVWLLPSAESAQLPVIAMMTWLIAAGGFMHVIAGGVEAFLLVLHGDLGLIGMMSQFLLPVTAGNIIGGTALFALISYAQVAREI